MYFLALKRSTLGFCRLLKDRSLKKWEKHRAHTLSTRQQVNHCWIIRDSERMRLLKSPRSLSVYILNLCIPHQRCKMRVSFSWGQNDLGTIFIRLNSLEKSRSRKKKKKNSLRYFSLPRYAVTGFTNNPAKSQRCLRGYMDSQARVQFAQIDLNSCLSLWPICD